MNYTFQKRKELNECFMKLFPDLGADYKRDGVPFIHIHMLPYYAKKLESVNELKKMIPVTPFPWHSVVPVAYQIKRLTKDGSFEELYEISFVNCTKKSLSQANERILKGNLWAFPKLVNLKH